MDQSIENEYVKITLSSMAADESYINEMGLPIDEYGFLSL